MFPLGFTLFPAAASGGPGGRSVDKPEEAVSSQRIEINSCLQLLRNDLWRKSLTYLKHLAVFFLKDFSILLFVQGVIFCFVFFPPEPPPALKLALLLTFMIERNKRCERCDLHTHTCTEGAFLQADVRRCVQNSTAALLLLILQ